MRSHRIPGLSISALQQPRREGEGSFSSWHQLSSPATSLPWVRVGLGGALGGSFGATFGVLNSLCLSGVHLIWCCGTFPGLLAWGWQEGLLRRWIPFPEPALPAVACPRLLCSVSQPRCPHSVLPSPADPDSVTKRPYIFQLSTSFPDLQSSQSALLRTHYFPAGS